MGHGPGILFHFAEHVQLGQCPLPLAQNGKQLEEENPVADIFRLFADLFLNILKRPLDRKSVV